LAAVGFVQVFLRNDSGFRSIPGSLFKELDLFLVTFTVEYSVLVGKSTESSVV